MEIGNIGRHERLVMHKLGWRGVAGRRWACEFGARARPELVLNTDTGTCPVAAAAVAGVVCRHERRIDRRKGLEGVGVSSIRCGLPPPTPTLHDRRTIDRVRGWDWKGLGLA